MRGKVKWFNDTKGYGFITGEDSKDVFVHFSEISASGFKSLKEGDEVEYETTTSDKGLKATKVVKI